MVEVKEEGEVLESVEGVGGASKGEVDHDVHVKEEEHSELEPGLHAFPPLDDVEDGEVL